MVSTKPIAVFITVILAALPAYAQDSTDTLSSAEPWSAGTRPPSDGQKSAVDGIIDAIRDDAQVQVKTIQQIAVGLSGKLQAGSGSQPPVAEPVPAETNRRKVLELPIGRPHAAIAAERLPATRQGRRPEGPPRTFTGRPSHALTLGN